MKKIRLTQQQVALVDDEDYEYLKKYLWTANKDIYENYYAKTTIKDIDDKNVVLVMHRFIMDTPKNMICDHAFHNTLDNRKFIEIDGELKENLRNCTASQNAMNRKSRKLSSSKYLGVCVTAKGLIVASIYVNKKQINLGTFNSEEEAAVTYDKAARKYFGKFANPNFKEEDTPNIILNNTSRFSSTYRKSRSYTEEEALNYIMNKLKSI